MKISLYSMATFYILAGVNHFLSPDFYLQMMPPYLPEPHLLNFLSGGSEIGLGLLLLSSKTQRFAALGIILLLIAVFPANIYMYQQGSSHFHFSDTGLLLRLPLQFVLMAWAYVHLKIVSD